MATSPKNRLFTADVTVMKITTETSGGTFGTFNHLDNLIGVFTNSKITFDVDTVIANVPKDLFDSAIHGFEFHVFQGYSWNVELNEVVDTTLDLTEFLNLALAITPAAGSGILDSPEFHRGICQVNFMRPGGQGGADKSYQGLGWFTRANIKISEGLQTQSATITGYGPLVQTGGL